MPLIYQKHISDTTRLAIWKIDESEDFFNLNIPLKQEITHPHKRLQHAAGRYLLPLLFPRFPTHEIEIADTRKPFLPNEEYHFSISHSADYAAAIVSSSHRVGVDVEVVNPRIDLVKHKFLHTDELAFIHAQLANEHIKLLSVAWNAKEAMYKWYGLGQVDFSNMMRLNLAPLQTQDVITGKFKKDGFEQSLRINYQFFDKLVLAWIA